LGKDRKVKIGGASEVSRRYYMQPKTITDISKIKELKKRIEQLEDEIGVIKNNCPCFDYEIDSIETFEFNITPVGICPVCKKIKRDISLEEKARYLESFFKNICLEDPGLTPEEIREIAKKGGHVFG
jgi:hypothetical protein